MLNQNFQIEACYAAGPSSGGECICQKSGFVSRNSTPVSTVRVCCVPRKTTRQSSSRCVSWLVSNNVCPLCTGTLSSNSAPFAFTFRVCASSWNVSVPGPWPYTYTETSSAQRRLLRLSGISAAFAPGGFGGALLARANCACFNASKIRLIFIVRPGWGWAVRKQNTLNARRGGRQSMFRFEWVTPQPCRETSVARAFSQPLLVMS